MVFRPMRYNGPKESHLVGDNRPLAEEKLYQAKYQGSGTFIISKPKRNKRKRRQLNLKNPNRGMRK